MAGTSYKVDITVTGQDQASKPLSNINQALNTLAGVAGGVMLAQGLHTAASLIMTAGKNAVSAAADMQRFNISLDTLAAREMVASGAAGNIGEALQEVGPITDDLTAKLRDLGLTSPFTFETIQNTFRMQMAFGQTADQSVVLTGALLDTASALGLDGEAADRLAYNFAQINSVGKITGIDLRQLRMVGLDLAAVFSDQLGMSVEEVNTALENGSITMKEVSDAFVNYASVNFAGAAERMSMTAAGLQSSFQDLFYFISTDLLSSGLETVTGYLQEFFNTARDLQASGYFEKLGEDINSNVQRIMAVFQDLLGADGPEGVLKKIGDAVVSVSDIIADGLEWWNGLDDSTKHLIVDIGLLAAATTPLYKGISSVLTLLPALQTGLLALAANPVGLAITAITLALGGLIIASERAADATEHIYEAQSEELNQIDDFRGAVDAGIITGEEYIHVRRRLAAETMTAAEAQEWLTQKTEEFNDTQGEATYSTRSATDANKAFGEQMSMTAEEVMRMRDAQAQLNDESEQAPGIWGELYGKYNDVTNIQDTLIEQGIQLIDGLGAQARATALLAYWNGELSLAEYQAAVTQSYQLDTLQSLNEALADGSITQLTWMAIMSDGVATTDELARALNRTASETETTGGQMQTTATGPAKTWENELRTINGLVDGAAGDYEINFDVSVTGDPIPSYDDSGGGGHNNAFASGTDGWRTVPSGYEKDNYPVFLSSGEEIRSCATG